MHVLLTASGGNHNGRELLICLSRLDYILRDVRFCWSQPGPATEDLADPGHAGDLPQTARLQGVRLDHSQVQHTLLHQLQQEPCHLFPAWPGMNHRIEMLGLAAFAKAMRAAWPFAAVGTNACA